MDKKRDYDEPHPELRAGEIFLTNSTLRDYVRMAWLTKRSGIQAYSTDGKKISGFMPVFVKRAEFEAGMKKYE
jgi:hypothetical protein